MMVYPPLPRNEMLNFFLHLEDLVRCRDKLLDENPNTDFIGWRLKSGEILLIHPWIQTYKTASDIHIWPTATLCVIYVKEDENNHPWAMVNYHPTNTHKKLEKLRPKKRWWQFWR